MWLSICHHGRIGEYCLLGAPSSRLEFHSWGKAISVGWLQSPKAFEWEHFLNLNLRPLSSVTSAIALRIVGLLLFRLLQRGGGQQVYKPPTSDPLHTLCGAPRPTPSLPSSCGWPAPSPSRPGPFAPCLTSLLALSEGRVRWSESKTGHGVLLQWSGTLFQAVV